jgi:hypothetical protein
VVATIKVAFIRCIPKFISRLSYRRIIAVKVEGNIKFGEVNLGRMMHSLVQWGTLKNLMVSAANYY